MGHRTTAVCAALVACLTAACSGDSTETPAPEQAASCAEPDSGTCLGELEAGTFTTQSLTPQLTYTVGDAWENTYDTAGVFLLLPPGRDQQGADAGTADYLGVYHAAAVAAADCSPATEAGVGLEPRAIVEALSDRAGLETSEPRQVDVGGLTGLMINIEMSQKGKQGCSIPELGRVIPLIVGVGQAHFGRVQAANMQTRLYVLEFGQENVVVEVSDVGADSAAFDYQRVVDSMRFEQD